MISAGSRLSWVLAWMIKEVRVAMKSATYVRLDEKLIHCKCSMK